eukprot:1881454-Heterocapsa_arctica.AAC.1
MDAVKNLGAALQYASAELKGDREVVMEAVLNNRDSLRHACADLRGDRELSSLFIQAALMHSGRL